MVRKNRHNFRARAASYADPGMGLPLGVAVGLVLGLLVFDNLALGLGVGMALGVAFGLSQRPWAAVPEPPSEPTAPGD